jgi:hypothetical protein
VPVDRRCCPPTGSAGAGDEPSGTSRLLIHANFASWICWRPEPAGPAPRPPSAGLSQRNPHAHQKTARHSALAAVRRRLVPTMNGPARLRAFKLTGVDPAAQSGAPYQAGSVASTASAALRVDAATSCANQGPGSIRRWITRDGSWFARPAVIWSSWGKSSMQAWTTSNFSSAPGKRPNGFSETCAPGASLFDIVKSPGAPLSICCSGGALPRSVVLGNIPERHAAAMAMLAPALLVC